MARHFPTAQHAVIHAIDQLKQYGVEVDTGHWQGVATEGKIDLVTRELIDLDLAFSIPHNRRDAIIGISPNMPWAEYHFQERVSRVPSNPGEEYKNWPWWRGQDDAAMKPLQLMPHHREDIRFTEPLFSHTYQERFWPKMADRYADLTKTKRGNFGIRYAYGDLDDVVRLLQKKPHTRQAYFPIFFPEDTGAVHGGRIPCSLGYHFLLRHNLLHCWYDIRSCDAVRHFRDDLYLAVRLVQWVLEELVELELREDDGPGLDRPQIWVDVNPGTMFFKAHSFHVHKGDMCLL